MVKNPQTTEFALQFKYSIKMDKNINKSEKKVKNAKQILNRNNSQHKIAKIHAVGKTNTNAIEITQTFVTHFGSIGRRLENSIQPYDNLIVNTPSLSNIFFLKPTHQGKVIQTFSHHLAPKLATKLAP